MKLSQSILSFFLPAACISCRGVLAYGEEGPLCPSCRSELKRIQTSFCRVCGDPFGHGEVDTHTCGKCLQDPPPFAWARSVFEWNDCLARILHALKYRGSESSVDWLSLEMARALEAWRERVEWDCLVPVPLHSFRLLKRGYNQSLRLSRALQKKLGTPLDWRGLQRRRYEKPQTFRSREERLKAIRGAFTLQDPSFFRDKRVLLIDDVFTTGATLREASRTLKKAGAQVFGLTIARTPLHFRSFYP